VIAATAINGIIMEQVKEFKYQSLGCRVSRTEANTDLEQNINYCGTEETLQQTN
jgi:hypothetical protein